VINSTDDAAPSDHRSVTDTIIQKTETGDNKLKLYAEAIDIEKESVKTGSVLVKKHTILSDKDIDYDLMDENAFIETIPKGTRVFAMPVTRVEGDTTIIPIVEEVVFTEKRLFLKEEIRVTRKRATHHFHDTVSLRHQEAVVSRVQSATEGSGSPSDRGSKESEE
jgi:uncharacterized protein (TIGR02271 family)